MITWDYHINTESNEDTLKGGLHTHTQHNKTNKPSHKNPPKKNMANRKQQIPVSMVSPS